MEMAESGDLDKYIKRNKNIIKKEKEAIHWKESKILSIFVQLLLALQKVHSLGFIKDLFAN